MLFLENKGQDGNLEDYKLKGQIIKSSSFKGNKNSEEDEENVKAVKMYETGKNNDGLKFERWWKTNY